ncbi:GNAT family N-acetyltransferase [Hyphobacterium marinum]|uniref:GNAT family N-acetyltransferase n=1 Tax=Hyphobacterium marinum TaxID=3116574 RepID=A0ABU7LUN0_9PROT|nr:GNAT family N-acetyltransferase [Hyphobacterium sp. Y6023]MEE2565253.1 GNAT family N-acetyltransferase [Hyphobacterium sp. Y6023]
MYRCEVVHPGELDAETRKAWSALTASAEFGSALLHPDFACAVGQVRADARVALYRQNGRLEAVLAYHARPGGLARPLAAPFSDLQAFVCAPGCTMSGAEALHLAGLRAYRFDALTDPRRRFGGVTARGHVHAIIPGPDINAFLEGLRAANPKRFKNHRRLARQMELQRGALDLITDDHDPRHFDQLLEWKHTQFARTGRHDVLKPAWAGKLMTGLFNGGTGEARGLMVSLKAGGRMVAGLFGVRTGDRYNPWVAAYDPVYAPWSPGQTLLHGLVEAMPALGLKRCDLGAGHGHYKKYYANAAIPVVAGLETAPGAARRATGLRTMLWTAGEHFPLTGLAARTASLHRRFDQISAADLDFPGRIAGTLRAFSAPRHGPQESAA